MRVKFGITMGYVPMILTRDDIAKFQDLVKMADDYGFSAIATLDSSFIAGDAFVRATFMALASERTRVGVRPTNPVTREPQIMAAFLASLDAMTGGRAFIDMASGDSAVLNIGRRPATRARIEEYIACVRELIATGTSTFEGRPQRVRWSPVPRQRIPIWITAEGPKMLQLAGRIADAVIAGTGLTAEVIQDTKNRVATGALEGGREFQDIETWFTTRTALDPDRDRAVMQARPLVAGILNHSMRAGTKDRFVPNELEASVTEYVSGYSTTDHVVADGENERRMELLGLTDFALDRWAIAGNASDWIDRITDIAQNGATNLWLMLGRDELDQQEKRLRVIGEQIMPQFA